MRGGRGAEGNEAVSMSKLLAMVDDAIVERSLLKHPFYRDWQSGKLSRKKLQVYAAQYYWHIEAFPMHLQALAERSKARLREIVLENLAEEENPAMPHAKLWRDFAAALGVSEELLWTSPALAGTEVLVETYGRICRERSVEDAVAALYAYEAQVPEIATTKIDGLRSHYNVTGAKGLAYFEVHQEADLIHRAAWRNWLEERSATSVVDENRIVTTVQTALDALWGALDAVQEELC
jgi:pyrroloquinoline-quinone synthase